MSQHMCVSSQKLPANILKSIPEIQSINLERNSIKSIHPQAFSGARRLMVLNLYGNQINKLPLKGFRDLVNLRFLMLGQNQISTINPEMLVGLRNLSDLDMPVNSITALPDNCFKPLVSLKVLDLALNRIQKLSPKSFEGLRELMFLNLDNNSLKTIPRGVFRPLVSLQTLVLDNNLLGTPSASMLEGLSALKELYLRNNEIQKLPRNFFKHTLGLTQLALSGNRLVALDGTSHVAGAPLAALRDVFLQDNPWRCNCGVASLVRWISQSTARSSTLGVLRCAAPPALQGKPFQSLVADNLKCKQGRPWNTLLYIYTLVKRVHSSVTCSTTTLDTSSICLNCFNSYIKSVCETYFDVTPRGLFS
uniref:Si:dkey-1j5.4 n=1 Tax=Scleropages formosus TaxID=113540 RepID=A0A8C9QLK3_SCLFO